MLVRTLLLLTLLSLPLTIMAQTFTQGRMLNHLPAVLPVKERAAAFNGILRDRLDNLLPRLMQENDLDMWLVIYREYGEDHLYYTLVPQPDFSARRTTILVFEKNADGSVERYGVSRYPIGDYYPTRWEGGDEASQWTRLAQLISDRDPQRIGINISQDWVFGDGLTVGLQQKLLQYLPKKYQERLTSAANLAVRWAETRTAKELEVYPQIVAIARAVIAEAFSNQVITPGVSTTEDVRWFIREKFESLDLQVWFQPDVNVQRRRESWEENAPFYGEEGLTILPGDVLHTDVGICYLGLCTDTQEMGYVLPLGETDVPAGLIEALALGNQWQDILTGEFKTGRTGNEILAATIKASKQAGLVSSTYSHPLGFVGHAPGMAVGMWDNQGPVPISGNWPLYPDTAYAIEGNIKTPLSEWDGQPIQIKLEQSAVFDGSTVWYLAGRQTQWHLVE